MEISRRSLGGFLGFGLDWFDVGLSERRGVEEEEAFVRWHWRFVVANVRRTTSKGTERPLLTAMLRPSRLP